MAAMSFPAASNSRRASAERSAISASTSRWWLMPKRVQARRLARLYVVCREPWSPSGAWVRLVVFPPFLVVGQVRVDLGRRGARVYECVLGITERHAAAEHVCRVGVSKRVRRDGPVEVCVPRIVLQNQPEPLARQPLPSAGHEQG